MSDNIAIRTENLSKTFHSRKSNVEAVKDLHLSVERGQVYGFLGPNGAGKSTTIRMLVDLVRPTQGVAYLFGTEVGADRSVLRRVGAMVEDPGFYGYLSARDNLKVLAKTAGYYDPNRVEELLELIGLADKADPKVGEYSTGMKQRLGVASTLLSDPELIVLDEPTNGLDPSGIQQMRDFIRELVETQAKTVFLSSHILHEVEQVCDRVAIINEGELIREGAVADLLGSNVDELRVKAIPQRKAAQIIGAKFSVQHRGEWLEVAASPEEAPEIIRNLVEDGIDVHQVIVRHQTLEEFFMEATGTSEAR